MNYFWLRQWRKIQNKLVDWFPAYDRWGSIRYAEKEYGHTREFLEQLWDEKAANFVPGQIDFLKMERTVGSDFFSELAKRRMNASVTYTCIEGNCSIMWDEQRDRYIAGFGRAGCPCNDVRDMTTRRTK